MFKSNLRKAFLNHYITPWWLLMLMAICFGVFSVITYYVGLSEAYVVSVFLGMVSLVSLAISLLNLRNYLKDSYKNDGNWAKTTF
jgi:hypothetical protein